MLLLLAAFIGGKGGLEYGAKPAIKKMYPDYYAFHAKRVESNDKIYKKLNPISIPKQLPSMEEIADSIFKSVDPHSFLFGGSTSEYQCSKKCTADMCTYSRYLEQRNSNKKNEQMPCPTDTKYKMNWWDQYKTYIDDSVTQLGLNAIRFSIEWSLVQPEGPNLWDQKVLDHYADLFVYCVKKGVTPLVCFHHYTDPVWFFNKGAFANMNNIEYFSTYTNKMYTHIMTSLAKDEDALKAYVKLGERTPKWFTFNAPAGYAFRVHRQEVMDETFKGLNIVAKATLGTCIATMQTSKALKKSFKQLGLPEIIQNPVVGFLKNGLQVDGADKYYSKSISEFFSAHADYIRHDAVYQFFTTGTFRVQIPKIVDIDYTSEDALGCLDIIGLNYYSNMQLFLTQKQCANTDPELATDGSTYYRYPAGMYRAIVELHEELVKPYEKATGRKLPMFVAENGIATNDNKKRARFYEEYMYAISKAVQDGYPVMGYTPWTLFDNYEWPDHMNNRSRNYGLFAVVDDGKHLQLKEGSKPLKQFADCLKKHTNNA